MTTHSCPTTTPNPPKPRCAPVRRQRPARRVGLAGSALLLLASVWLRPAGAVVCDPPEINLRSPLEGTVAVAPASFSLEATTVVAVFAGSCNATNVKFYANGVLLFQDNASPWSYQWNAVPVGQYALTAVATDVNGTQSISSPVNVTVTSGAPNQPPTVSLVLPLAGTTVPAPGSFTLTANASDSDGGISSVQFFRNGVAIGSDSTSPYSLTDSGLAAGSYSYTARATDNANPAASTTSAAVSVSVSTSAVNQPPTVSLASPASGTSATAPASFVVAANASDPDGSVAKVEFFRSGALIGTVSTPPYSLVQSNVGVGSYSYTARATDNASPAASTTSAAATVTVVAAAPSSLTRTYVYDDAQRLCKRIEPESGATLFDYDAAGNLAWRAEGQNLLSKTCDRQSVPVSARILMSYDARNRLTRTDYPGTTPDIDRSYYADGAPRTVTSAATVASAGNTWTHEYNKRRLLTREVLTLEGSSYAIGYDYDGNASATTLEYPDGSQLSYLPNALGQPTAVGSQASAIRYTADGAIKSFVYGNGISHTMTQNARRLPGRSRDAGPGGVVLDDSYSFDANGNVRSIVDQANAGRSTRTLAYDAKDRLVSASAPGLWGQALFAYDALDNLQSADQGGRQYRYQYDTAQRLARITDAFGSTQWSYSYNASGDRIGKNAQAYSFDAAHRLSAVNGIASYVYDGRGRRVKQTRTNGTVEISVYNSAGQRLYRKQGSTTNRYLYLGNTLLAEQKTENGVARPDSYFHTDALGSPVASTDAAGRVIERTDYAPYGEALNRSVDGPGYTGHVMDADTGLVYAQQRYYDPLIGRFLSIDPVEADANTGTNFNRYWYANNNPYRFTDPDGRSGAPVFVLPEGVAQLAAAMAKNPTRETAERISRGDFTPAPGIPSQISDRLSVNATAKASLGSGFQATKNIVNGEDSVGFVSVGAGAFAGVSVDVNLISVDLGNNVIDTPFSVEVSGDIGLGGALGGTISFDPGGKLDVDVSIGAGIGEHVTYGPVIDVEVEEK